MAESTGYVTELAIATLLGLYPANDQKLLQRFSSNLNTFHHANNILTTNLPLPANIVNMTIQMKADAKLSISQHCDEINAQFTEYQTAQIYAALDPNSYREY